MDNKNVITPVQLVLMSIGSGLIFPFIFMPILSAPPANQDAWIVLILSSLFISIIAVPSLFLINKFRDVDVNEMAEMILGGFLGKAAAVVFVAFFIFCFTACTLISVIGINLYVLPLTPPWVLLLCIIISASYPAYKGAGTIGRLASLLVPLIILAIIIFLLLAIDHMDLSRIKPVLADSTLLQINQGAFLTAARFSEVLIFLVFSFFLPQESSINKTFVAALSIFMVLNFIMLLPVLTVLGVEFGKHAWSPYFVFSRQVGAYDFIERVHSLNVLTWFPVNVLKLAIYNFMGSYVLSNAVKAKSHKSFVILLSIIAFIICLLPMMNELTTISLLISDQVFPFIIIFFSFVMPTIIAIVYLIRRKKVDRLLQQNKTTEANRN